ACGKKATPPNYFLRIWRLVSEPSVWRERMTAYGHSRRLGVGRESAWPQISDMSGRRTAARSCRRPWYPARYALPRADRRVHRIHELVRSVLDNVRRRQCRFSSALYHLGIRARLALRQHLLDKLDAALNLLVGHLLNASAVLDFHFPRH